MISNHILHGDSPVTKNFDNDELEFDYKNIARTIDNSIIYPKRKSKLINEIVISTSDDLTKHNKISKKKSTRKKKKAPKKKTSTKRKQTIKKKRSIRKKKSATKK